MPNRTLPTYSILLLTLTWSASAVAASPPRRFASHVSSSSGSSTNAATGSSRISSHAGSTAVIPPTFNRSSSSRRRSLLGSSACAAASSKLLTNGYFRLDDPAHLTNALVAATMANDVYPWSRDSLGATIAQVVEGLSPQQVDMFKQKFTAKYMKLGATSVQFVDYYSPTKEVAAHAVVIGTPRTVFLVFRGTADVGQFITTMNPSSVTTTIYNKTVELYQAPYRSVMGAWPEILSAVEQAVRATELPEDARVILSGHSLGGASAFLAALLLSERGYKIGGVYAFGPYKMGTTCAQEEDCWVTVYDRHLARVTHVWWNNQDPVPGLLDYMHGTSGGESSWGHVPRSTGWTRVVGNDCVPSSGTRLEETCPPEIDAADGKADGQCTKNTFLPHMQWKYLQKVARCTLLQNPHSAAGNSRSGSTLRIDQCSMGAVWTDLLGLPVPIGTNIDAGSVESTLSSLTGGVLDKRPRASMTHAKPGLRH